MQRLAVDFLEGGIGSRSAESRCGLQGDGEKGDFADWITVVPGVLLRLAVESPVV